jgi:hypothetical protein
MVAKVTIVDIRTEVITVTNFGVLGNVFTLKCEFRIARQKKNACGKCTLQ